MEPFFITIGDQTINPQHIASAKGTDEDGGTLRVYMVGVLDNPIIFTGEEAKIMWQAIISHSRERHFPRRF